MTTKTKRIPELHVGRGQQAGPLTVFPVWTGAPSLAGLVMGLAADVAVAEREGSPVVCVEAGCWHGGGADVRRARRASGNVRAAMNATDECR